MSNSLDPDQARQYVGPDVDPNSLQKLSGDNTDGKELIEPVSSWHVPTAKIENQSAHQCSLIRVLVFRLKKQ